MPTLLTRSLPILLLLACSAATARGTYQEPADFIAETFGAEPPSPDVIWLRGDTRDTATAILGHRYPSLRVRYWGDSQRSAWILEEIGKDQPITVGLVVSDGRLERIKVLVFRESRGWEVRHPFFTDQFREIGLTDKLGLDRDIDGISGATLSVRALKKLARLALYLHSVIPPGNDTP
jgi:hypothetical protein